MNKEDMIHFPISPDDWAEAMRVGMERLLYNIMDKSYPFHDINHRLRDAGLELQDLRNMERNPLWDLLPLALKHDWYSDWAAECIFCRYKGVEPDHETEKRSALDTTTKAKNNIDVKRCQDEYRHTISVKASRKDSFMQNIHYFVSVIGFSTSTMLHGIMLPDFHIAGFISPAELVSKGRYRNGAHPCYQIDIDDPAVIKDHKALEGI